VILSVIHYHHNPSDCTRTRLLQYFPRIIISIILSDSDTNARTGHDPVVSLENLYPSALQPTFCDKIYVRLKRQNYIYKSHAQGKEHSDVKRNRTKHAHVNSTGNTTTVNLTNIITILTSTIGVVSSASAVHFIFSNTFSVFKSRGSAVGIATGYGPAEQGVGVRVPVKSRILIFPYRPDRLRPTKPPIQWAPGFFIGKGYRNRSVKPTTHLQQEVPRSRKRVSIHPLPHTSSWCSA
jgi:hypothetical protein